MSKNKTIFTIIFMAMLSIGCDMADESQSCSDGAILCGIIPSGYTYSGADFIVYDARENEGIEPTFLVFGDSRTAMGWYTMVFQNKIIDYSMPGQTTCAAIFNILNNVDKSLYNKNVLVSIGGNDLLLKNNIDEIYSNFVTIIKILRMQKHNRIYIQEIMPLVTGRTFKRQAANLNSRLKTLCQSSKTSNDLIFIETPSMKNEEGYLRSELSYDGVHYVGEGYSVMYDDYVGQIDLFLKDEYNN